MFQLLKTKKNKYLKDYWERILNYKKQDLTQSCFKNQF
ncbi:hypothetical protein K682_1440 [Campylobacter jejuni HB-CJGB-ZX]|nr:hypothetical protein K687_1466 [Campylobacter jejuni HB-CJGB-LL]PNS88437.1 hypothetical protein K682_1440 [Campylobacter jejuni HB-CJGB-ZX]